MAGIPLYGEPDAAETAHTPDIYASAMCHGRFRSIPALRVTRHRSAATMGAMNIAVPIPDRAPDVTRANAISRPTGLYIHVPFCETKCGYCDFYSVAMKDRDPGPLVDRIVRELKQRTAGLSGRIQTIFIGGGTPTILPVGPLRQLLEAVSACVDRDQLEEYTVEANPATVDDDKACLLAGSGVTRVSMGAQSFFPAELETLERLHTPDDIAPSVATLRRNGIAQLNIDLIFGIPGQTIATWSESLRRAIELEPDHIACYGLTFEPGTRLTAMHHAGRLRSCDEDLEAEMFFQTIDVLHRAGYRQYETSNFARPGCECRHNLIYWRNQDYIGVGPSAAGCVDGRRYKNIADIAGYVRLIDERSYAEAESESIQGETLMLELLMMQLRLAEGLSTEDFKRRTGVDPRSLFAAALGPLVDRGMLRVSETHIALTRAGRLIADRVLRDLACTIDRSHITLPVLT